MRLLFLYSPPFRRHSDYGAQEVLMYVDSCPIVNGPTNKVVVVKRGDPAAEIIQMARDHGAVTQGHDGETFWIVEEGDPRRVWDFTEGSLRRSYR